MTRFLLRRLGHGLVSILGASLVIFIISRLSGDPIALLLPPDAPAQVIAAARGQLGLDQPLWWQYLIFVTQAAQGEFGQSYRWQMPALELVLDRLPATVELACAGMQLPSPAQRLGDYPHQFSVGQRQRIATAMAIACAPRLLLADEPTTALDVTIQAQIIALLRRIQQESGAGIILITHDLGVAASLCTRIAVMYAGRIVEQGAIREVYRQPAHPYTRVLLDSVPRPDPDFPLPAAPAAGEPASALHPPAGCRFHPRCPHVMPACRAEPRPPAYVAA